MSLHSFWFEELNFLALRQVHSKYSGHPVKQFEINKVLDLTKGNKYEVACASFDVVDHIFKLDVPRGMKGRKLAVQAMSLLGDGQVKFGYEKEPESN